MIVALVLIALFMMVASFISYGLAKLYVAALLFIGRNYKSFSRAISGFITYLMFALFLVAPYPFSIFIAMNYLRRQLTFTERFILVGWAGFCFLFHAIPSLNYIYEKKLDELRSVGFFQKRKKPGSATHNSSGE